MDQLLPAWMKYMISEETIHRMSGMTTVSNICIETTTHTHVDRLNTYHYFWKETLGFLLPSDVSLREPNLKIADIGTGSA